MENIAGNGTEPRSDQTIAALLRDPRLLRRLFGTKFFYSDLVENHGITSTTLRQLGFSDEEMRDGTYHERIHPEDLPTYLALWQRVRAGWEDELYCEYRLCDKEGRWHWIETHAHVVERRPDGTMATIFGVDREISSRKHAEEYLHRRYQETERRYEVAESLRQTSTLLSADLELTDNLVLGLRQLSSIVEFEHCEVFAFEQGELRKLLIHPYQEGIELPVEEPIVEELKETYYPVIHDDVGEQFSFRSLLAVPLRERNAGLGGVFLWHPEPGFYRGQDLYPVLAFADILAVAIRNNQRYRRTVAELEADALTGFLTRRSFDRDAPALWQEYQDLYPENAVAMVDIDHFKRINDGYGHPVGDLVIRTIAELFSLNLRKGDILGRYGGEEFVALLPNTPAAAARQIMERIRSACEGRDMCEFAGNVTVSIGITASSARRPLEEMIAEADQALYRAKHNGRNRVELF